MSAQVFLSYSRTDYRSARLLWEILQSRLHCKIFMDIVANCIPPGDVFPKAVEEAISSSSAFVLLVGKTWSGLRGERPIDDPENWVRREISLALNNRSRIIPVLLDGVRMPSAAELPEEIASLTQHQAIEIRDLEFDRDIEPLVETLEGVVGGDILKKPDASLLVADFLYYFNRFAKLLAAPKRVVRAFTATPSGELARSLMFLAISLMIYSLFTVPLYADRPRMVVWLFVQYWMFVLMVFTSAAVLQLSWRVVGGAAPFRRYLSITSYYFGVNGVLGICLVATAMGVITLFDPQLLHVLKEAAEGNLAALAEIQPLRRPAFRAALWVIAGGNSLLLIWTYAFWGAYREINGASRLSSFAAYLIASIATLPVGAIFVLIQAFLFNRLETR